VTIHPENAPHLNLLEKESDVPLQEDFPQEVTEEVGDEAINQLSQKLLKDFLADDDEFSCAGSFYKSTQFPP